MAACQTRHGTAPPPEMQRILGRGTRTAFTRQKLADQLRHGHVGFGSALARRGQQRFGQSKGQSLRFHAPRLPRSPLPKVALPVPLWPG